MKNLNKFVMENWEIQFEEKIREIATSEDPAHDLLHFKRVVKTAKRLCEIEKANFEVVVPAAWLHDFVIVAKNDSKRSQASKLSAEAAINFISSIGYPDQYFANIAHSIEAHSFSANIETKTKEAMIVQDADRLDGLGAIGIARCFATAGVLKRLFYELEDPFCAKRIPNDQIYTIDHFYQKLFKTAETLKTEAGKKEGLLRIKSMKEYLNSLSREL